MPKLRVLSGADVVAILKQFGFSVGSQRGSHVKMFRQKSTGTQTLTIPNHKEIGKGTLKDIFNQALPYIPEADLRPHFYTE